MKKIIKIVGIIAIMGSVGVASTNFSDVVGVSKSGVEDITTVQWGCDPILRMMGFCRSSETLPTDK